MTILNVFPNTSDIFPEYYALSEFDMVLYDKDAYGTNVLMAIEIDGGEHYSSKKSLENDRKKELLCKQHGIRLFRVPNAFASHYSFIKEYIAAMPENPGQQELFDTDSNANVPTESDTKHADEKTEGQVMEYKPEYTEGSVLEHNDGIKEEKNTEINEEKQTVLEKEIYSEETNSQNNESQKAEIKESIFSKGLKAITSLFKGRK